MDTFLPSLGLWFWFIVAAVLLIGELLMPGVFLLWLGIGATATGLVDAMFGLDWRGEVVTFGVSSLVLVAASWKYVTSQWRPHSDQPHLNQRHYTYVGRTVILETAIVDGRGKVKIDDTIWDVEGNNAEAGTPVTVRGVNGMRLVVG